MTNATATDVKISPITLDNFHVSEYQKDGSITAQLRQVLVTTSTYDAIKVSSDLGDNMFESSDFVDAKPNEYESTENRVAFLTIPAFDLKDEKVLAEKTAWFNAKLVEYMKAGSKLYRILSYAPILTNLQKDAIAAGLTTKDKIGNAQVTRDDKKQIVVRDGKVIYRAIFFGNKDKQDQEWYGVEPYQTPEIEVELLKTIDAEGEPVIEAEF